MQKSSSPRALSLNFRNTTAHASPYPHAPIGVSIPLRSCFSLVQCFPADARVMVQGAGALPMHALRIGHRVLTIDASGQRTFEEARPPSFLPRSRQPGLHMPAAVRKIPLRLLSSRWGISLWLKPRRLLNPRHTRRLGIMAIIHQYYLVMLPQGLYPAGHVDRAPGPRLLPASSGSGCVGSKGAE